MARFTNLARGNEIGANCYHLELDGAGIVLDAGMHPKLDGYHALPLLDLLDKRRTDAIFLSHAHHDHTGSLPLVMERVPEAKVFMGEATYFLADALLHNSVNVMKRQRIEAGLTEYPLFTHETVTRLVKRWQACHLRQRWTLDGFPTKDKDGVTFVLHPAGHILGSAAVELESRGQRILYTGDINLCDQTLMRRADLPEHGIDVLITETTRGGNPTPEGFSRKVAEQRLIEALNEVYNNDGCVLMPIFAMGKTQELLTFLHDASRRGLIPHDTFYIGGLGKVFTEIYDKLSGQPDRQHNQLQIAKDIRPQVLDWRRLQDSRPKKNHLYLLPSGMMTAQTTSNRIAYQFLNKPENAVFFVGYCEPDSPAGRLRATPQNGAVILNREDGEQKVRSRVQHFDFTSHALREDILAYILRVNPRHCVLVHGDRPALNWFQAELAAARPEMRVTIPESGVEIEL